jgi:putative aldouronate transport system substrate-binding protein
MASAAADEMSQKIAQLEVKSMEVNSSYEYRRDVSRNPDVAEYGVLYADWSLIEQQLMVQAITGGESYTVENMMADLQKEWNNLGGTEVTGLVQQWYDTTYAD